ncbi:Protein SZT2 [Trichinella nativa]|uniref:Protein SZT2 n=1 Tax=Trichinella nativa TaxID=6335 RepID=A0A0V1LPM1_9BILA|nr:Protein SZT2 [Trichinella nativa]
MQSSEKFVQGADVIIAKDKVELCTAYPAGYEQYQLVSKSTVNFFTTKARVIFILNYPASVSIEQIHEHSIEGTFCYFEEALVGLLQPFKPFHTRLSYCPKLILSVIACSTSDSFPTCEILALNVTLSSSNVQSVLSSIRKQYEKFQAKLLCLNEYYAQNFCQLPLLADETPWRTKQQRLAIGKSVERHVQQWLASNRFSLPDAIELAISMVDFSQSISTTNIILLDSVVNDHWLGKMKDRNFTNRLRALNIRVHFIPYRWSRSACDSIPGQVSCVENIQYVINSLNGCYIDVENLLNQEENKMTIYQRAIFVQTVPDGEPVAPNLINSALQIDSSFQIVQKRQEVNAKLQLMLKIRISEGFTIRSVQNSVGNIQVHMMRCLGQSTVFKCTVISDLSNVGRPLTVEWTVAKRSAVLKNTTASVSYLNARNALKCELMENISEHWKNDCLLEQFELYSTNLSFHSIPPVIEEGMPIYDLISGEHLQNPRWYRNKLSASMLKLHVMCSLDRLKALETFCTFWGTVGLLDINEWSKWFNVESFSLILNNRVPIGSVYSSTDDSGTLNKVNCDQAFDALKVFFKNYTTFSLDKGTSFVSFIKSDFTENDKAPSFYLLKFILHSFVGVCHFAFSKEISPSQRDQIITDMKNQLSKLPLISENNSNYADQHCSNSTEYDANACFLLTRPLEKLLVRHNSAPVFPFASFQESEMNTWPSNVTVGRYFHFKRYFWYLNLPGFVRNFPPNSVLSILQLILQRVLKTGFRIAHSEEGFTTLVKEIPQQNDITEELSTFLIQYVIYPPIYTGGDFHRNIYENMKYFDIRPDMSISCTVDYEKFPVHETEIVTEIWVESFNEQLSTVSKQRAEKLFNQIYKEDFQLIRRLVVAKQVEQFCHHKHIRITLRSPKEIVWKSLPDQTLRRYGLRCVEAMASSDQAQFYFGNFCLNELLHSCHLTTLLLDTATVTDGIISKLLSSLYYSVMYVLKFKSGEPIFRQTAQCVHDLFYTRMGEKYSNCVRIENKPLLFEIWKLFLRRFERCEHPDVKWLAPMRKRLELFQAGGRSPALELPRLFYFALHLSQSVHYMITFAPMTLGDIDLMHEEPDRNLSRNVLGTQWSKLCFPLMVFYLCPQKIYSSGFDYDLDRVKEYHNVTVQEEGTLSSLHRQILLLDEIERHQDYYPLNGEELSCCTNCMGSYNFCAEVATLQDSYMDCFVCGIYKSLCAEFPVYESDIRFAIENHCVESTLELDITEFLHTECHHMVDYQNMSDSDDLCCFRLMDIAVEKWFTINSSFTGRTSPLFNLPDCDSVGQEKARNLFQAVLQNYFQTIPTCTDYLICKPLQNDSRLLHSLDEGASNSDIESLATAMLFSSNDSGHPPDMLFSDNLSFESVSSSSSSDSYESFVLGELSLQLDDISEREFEVQCSEPQCYQHPIFLQISCSVFIGNKQYNFRVDSLPTCIVDLFRRSEINDWSNDMERIRVVLQFNILTLDLTPLEVGFWSRNTEQREIVNNMNWKRKKFYDGKVLVNASRHLYVLPTAHKSALISFYNRVLLLIRSEIICGYSRLPIINDAVIETVVEHIKCVLRIPLNLEASVHWNTIPLLFVLDCPENLKQFLDRLMKLNVSNCIIKRCAEDYFIIRECTDENQVSLLWNSMTYNEYPNPVVCRSNGGTLRRCHSFSDISPRLVEKRNCILKNTTWQRDDDGSHLSYSNLNSYEFELSSITESFYQLREEFSNRERQQAENQFWLILQMNMSKVNGTTKLDISQSRHSGLFVKVYNEIVQILKTTNQYMLLQRMFKTKKSSYWLIDDRDGCDRLSSYTPDVDSIIAENGSGDAKSDVEIEHLAAGRHYGPAYFACPVVAYCLFRLHPRCERLTAATLFRRVLCDLFGHTDDQNVFLYKNSEGNVYYIRVYDEFKIEAYRMVKRCYKQFRKELKMAKIRLLRSEKLLNCTFVTVHGIEFPGLEVVEKVFKPLRAAFDNFIIRILVSCIKNDPNHLLFENCNVTTVHFVPSPLVKQHLPAFSYYLRQILGAAGHIPRHRATSDGLWKSNFAPQAEPNDLFMCILHSGSDGIAVVMQSFVDHQGIQVNFANSNCCLDVRHGYKHLVQFLDNFEELIINAARISDPPDAQENTTDNAVENVYVKFVAMLHGSYSVQTLMTVLIQAIKDATFDLLTEYSLLTLPLFCSFEDHEKLKSAYALLQEREFGQTHEPSLSTSSSSVRLITVSHDLFSIPGSLSGAEQQTSSFFQNDAYVNMHNLSNLLEESPSKVVLNSIFYDIATKWLEFGASSHFNNVHVSSFSFSVRKDLHLLIEKCMEILKEFSNSNNHVLIFEKLNCGKRVPYFLLKLDEHTTLVPTALDQLDYCNIVIASMPLDLWEDSMNIGQMLEISDLPDTIHKFLSTEITYTAQKHFPFFKFDDRTGKWNFITRQRLALISILANEIKLYIYNFASEFVDIIRDRIQAAVIEVNNQSNLAGQISTCKLNYQEDMIWCFLENMPNRMIWLNPVMFMPVKCGGRNGTVMFSKAETVEIGSLLTNYEKTSFCAAFVATTSSNRLNQQVDNFVHNQQIALDNYKFIDKLCKIIFNFPNESSSAEKFVEQKELESISEKFLLVSEVQLPILFDPTWRNGTSVNSKPNRLAEESRVECWQLRLQKLLLQEFVSYLLYLDVEFFQIPVTVKQETENQSNWNSAWFLRICTDGVALLHVQFDAPYLQIILYVFPTVMLHLFGYEAKSCLRDLYNDLLTKCHFHSFVHDFHLKTLTFTADRGEEGEESAFALFPERFNVQSFLLDFYHYYAKHPIFSNSILLNPERVTFKLPVACSPEEIFDSMLEEHSKFQQSQQQQEKHEFRVVKMGENSGDKQHSGFFLSKWSVNIRFSGTNGDEENCTAYSLFMFAGGHFPLNSSESETFSDQLNVNVFTIYVKNSRRQMSSHYWQIARFQHRLQPLLQHVENWVRDNFAEMVCEKHGGKEILRKNLPNILQEESIFEIEHQSNATLERKERYSAVTEDSLREMLIETLADDQVFFYFCPQSVRCLEYLPNSAVASVKEQLIQQRLRFYKCLNKTFEQSSFHCLRHFIWKKLMRDDNTDNGKGKMVPKAERISCPELEYLLKITHTVSASVINSEGNMLMKKTFSQISKLMRKLFDKFSGRLKFFQNKREQRQHLVLMNPNSDDYFIIITIEKRPRNYNILAVFRSVEANVERDAAYFDQFVSSSTLWKEFMQVLNFEEVQNRLVGWKLDSLLAKPNKFQGELSLLRELSKIKQDGLKTENYKQETSQKINGLEKAEKIEETTLKNAKTGKTLSKTTTDMVKDYDGKIRGEKILDIPPAKLHKVEVAGDKKEAKLLNPRDMATYIFETSDVDGVKAVIDSFVKSKKMTEEDAENYMNQVTKHLNTMHVELLQQLSKEIRLQNEKVDKAYNQMLSLSNVLSNNYQAENLLYANAKMLFWLYKNEGDVYAKKMLQQFVETVQAAAAQGSVDDSTRKLIYGVVLRAIKDASVEIPDESSDIFYLGSGNKLTFLTD